MSKSGRKLIKTIATRSVIAVIPVAMASAYASNMVAPTPPRLAEYAYQQVAEITVSPNTVGVAESPLYGQTKQQIDAQLDQLQALGVQSIRVFVPWGLIDYWGPSAAGSASWSNIDLVMQAAKERNMGVLAEFDSTPPYAVTGGTGSNTPDPAAFSAFLTKFVNAYGSTVSAYEIWNEQNGVLSSNPISPSSYAALLKAAYNTIKPLDPTATVVMGGLGHVITVNGLSMDPVDFVNAMIAADPTIGNYFDALAYHPYDNTTSFSGGNLNPAIVGSWAGDTAYNQVKDLMALFPSKKVWITEFGVPTYSYTYTDFFGNTQTVSVTQAQQAALIQDFLSNWSSLGSQAGPVFLYTGQDTDTGSTDPEKNYGLYDDQGNPKSVIAWLTQWFIDHPQTATAPTNPGNAGAATNPLAAIIQSIVQSFTNAIAQFQAVFANFAKAIVNAISSLFGQPVAPAAQVTTTAAPQTMKLAAKVVSDPSSTTDEATADTAKTAATPAAEEVSAAESAAAPTVEPAATPAVETAAATPAVETAAATPAVEPTAETVAPATPTAATPAPAAAAESAAAPAAEPAAASPATSPATTPSSTEASSGSSAGTTGGDSDKGGASTSTSTDSTSTDTSATKKATKPDKASSKHDDAKDKTDGSTSTKSGSSDSTGSSDGSASGSTSGRHAKDKGGNDFSPRHVKPSSASEGAGAGKSGAEASSTSGSSSEGGGAEG